MSTFKYLSEAQNSNAATEFLQKQLGKNKYTSGDPYAYGEGATPGGEGYRDQLKVTNQKQIDDWHAANPDYKEGGGESVNGKMSAEELREKFGFFYNEEHAKQKGGFSKYGGKDNGAIYDVKTGEYVGSITGFKPKGGSKKGPDDPAQGIGKFEVMQDHELQHGFRDSKRSRWNSMNDVAGAVQNILGEGGEKKEPPKPEFKMDPIKHSPEINQAKERVKNYEEDVMSGKTSQEIYGKGEQLADDKYVFDATKGMAGIGTSPVSASKQGAADATQSFLNNKVSQVKKTLSPA
jgi:hypothetical protein